MRILWLSNSVFSDRDQGSTGTWLGAMARMLAGSGQVELGNISSGKVVETIRQDSGPIQQWVIPYPGRLGRDGLPDTGIIARINTAIESFAPDLIHIWGTESYWGLLTARRVIDRPVLLEIQGLKLAIARVFNGGLSPREQLACIGIKEVLRRSTMSRESKRFVLWGEHEREMIEGHGHVAVQSDWAEAQIRAINGSCRIVRSDLMLREPFCSSLSWRHTGAKRIFCSAAYPAPFKGLHVALRAVALLEARFPGIQCRIAGAIQKKGLRIDGYTAWLNRLAQQLKIESNIEWLGPLDAHGLIDELLAADVMLLPSYMENCSTTMQEAMLVGTPVVASYTGGLPSLATDGQSALFFPTGDEALCAYQAERLISNCSLAERLSAEGKKVAAVRNDPQRIMSQQTEIYRQVLAAAKERRS